MGHIWVNTDQILNIKYQKYGFPPDGSFNGYRILGINFGAGYFLFKW